MASALWALHQGGAGAQGTVIKSLLLSRSELGAEVVRPPKRQGDNIKAKGMAETPGATRAHDQGSCAPRAQEQTGSTLIQAMSVLLQAGSSNLGIETDDRGQ